MSWNNFTSIKNYYHTFDNFNICVAFLNKLKCIFSQYIPNLPFVNSILLIFFSYTKLLINLLKNKLTNENRKLIISAQNIVGTIYTE